MTTTTYRARRIRAGEYEYRGYGVTALWNSASGTYWEVTAGSWSPGAHVLVTRDTLRDAKAWIDRQP